jgi:hypothetical protein
MSIFATIWSKITGQSKSSGGQPVVKSGATVTASATGSSGAPAASAPAPTGSGAAPVDVTAVLDGLAAKASQTLDWRKSIVDLMKLLDLDSSITARKELAKELNYNGDTSDSATMNVWLHKQVMQKFAQNGGKVPDDLKN